MIFESFCFYFGAVIAKIFNITKRYLPKKFLETLRLFSQPQLSRKKRDRIILILPVTSRDQFKFGKPLLRFFVNWNWEDKFKIFGEITFLGDSSLPLLNIVATAALE